MSLTLFTSLKRLIASTVIWASISLFTMMLFLVMLLVTTVTFPFDTRRSREHSLCFWWSDAVIGVNRYWNVTLKGLENIDHHRTYIIVANHQSLADIALLFQTRAQFKWIAKASLFKIPFLGWCMSLARHVPLRRDNISSARRVYHEASDWIDKGISVMFFPEGTRSTSGELQNFHLGAFKLALKKNVPVLPIAIQGTSKAMPKGKWIFNPDGDISLTVLPVIESEDFQLSGPESLMKAARDKINE
ncbi:MAG: lysophospholipid acyltransferase family protein [Desulfobacula sp.]|jgi:1-acyl-sn-glycerol-3-phosphate acyltransferase|nr:lysophospholipid acyltransferase family protein [Desulfobacula sp.]